MTVLRALIFSIGSLYFICFLASVLVNTSAWWAFPTFICIGALVALINILLW